MSQKSQKACNHKEIEKNGKTVITNKAFGEACKRIEAGELDVYYKVVDSFSLESTQAQLLKQVYDKAKKLKV